MISRTKQNQFREQFYTFSTSICWIGNEMELASNDYGMFFFLYYVKHKLWFKIYTTYNLLSPFTKAKRPYRKSISTLVNVRRYDRTLSGLRFFFLFLGHKEWKTARTKRTDKKMWFIASILVRNWDLFNLPRKDER